MKELETGTKLDEDKINSLLISDLFKIITKDEKKHQALLQLKETDLLCLMMLRK